MKTEYLPRGKINYLPGGGVRWVDLFHTDLDIKRLPILGFSVELHNRVVDTAKLCTGGLPGEYKITMETGSMADSQLMAVLQWIAEDVCRATHLFIRGEGGTPIRYRIPRTLLEWLLRKPIRYIETFRHEILFSVAIVDDQLPLFP